VRQLNLISSNQYYLLTFYENILNISHYTLYCGIGIKAYAATDRQQCIKTSQHFN